MSRLGRNVAFFRFPHFTLLSSSHPDGRGSVAILVCGCSPLLEAYWRRVLRQDEWRADSLGSMGKPDSCPLKRNASGNWGSRGVSPLAGSRGWPRVEGLGREASLPSLAFWELFLHRKSSPGGVEGGAPPHKTACGPQARSAEGRRSRPPPSSAEDHRFPPARASLCKEVKRPVRQRTIDLPVSTMRWETSGFM